MGNQHAPVLHGLHRLIGDVQSPSTQPSRGLDGVSCGSSRLIRITSDHIHYCGVDFADLISEPGFESCAFLLLQQTLPDVEYLADTCSLLADSAVIESPLAQAIAAIPLQTRPLEFLPLSVSLLSCIDPTPDDSSLTASLSRFWKLLAQIPVLLHVGLGGSLVDGEVAWSESGSDRAETFAGNLLRILRQDEQMPSPREEAAMNRLLTAMCLTEMRPACFSARVAGGCVNDLPAALCSATKLFVTQLKNDPYEWASAKLRSFRSPDEATQWLATRQKRDCRQLWGFASPEEADPRTALLMKECNDLLGSFDQLVVAAVASRVESAMEDDDLTPTLDWAAMRLLTLLNVPEERISLAIGIARLVGWAAHAAEQNQSGTRLLPQLESADL